MFKKIMAVTLLLSVLIVPVVNAEVNAVTPSTNDINKTKQWAHFDVDAVRAGEVDLSFVSTRAFAACFEYRLDGAAPISSSPNYNADIADGLYSAKCVNNSTAQITLEACEQVEVRMVFGAEKDERFDWTTVYVGPGSTAASCIVDEEPATGGGMGSGPISNAATPAAEKTAATKAKKSQVDAPKGGANAGSASAAITVTALTGSIASLGYGIFRLRKNRL